MRLIEFAFNGDNLITSELYDRILPEEPCVILDTQHGSRWTVRVVINDDETIQDALGAWEIQRLLDIELLEERLITDKARIQRCLNV